MMSKLFNKIKSYFVKNASILVNDTNTLTCTIYNVVTKTILDKSIHLIYRPNTGDISIFNGVFNEYNLIGYVNRLKNKNATFVDIGGHIGSFSLLMTSLVPNSKSYLFELMRQNFQIINANIMLNGLEKRIYTQLAAVSDLDGETIEINPFNLSDKVLNTGGTSIAFEPIKKTSRTESVYSVSFSRFLDEIEHVDLLKIDCEASEYKILFSLSSRHFSKIDSIVGEIHDNKDLYLNTTNGKSWKAEELIKFLRNYYNVIIHHTAHADWGFIQIFSATKI